MFLYANNEIPFIMFFRLNRNKLLFNEIITRILQAIYSLKWGKTITETCNETITVIGTYFLINKLKQNKSTNS